MMASLRVKLLARSVMRKSGGYGYVGFSKAVLKIGASCIAVLSAMQLAQFAFCNWESECLKGETDVFSGFAVNVIGFSVCLLLARQTIIESVAQSLGILPELNDLATMQNDKEAAMTLSELHAHRGADVHAALWLERAATLGHRGAIKYMKREKGQKREN